MAGPVREAFQQIDADSWLIGAKTVLKRTTAAGASGHLWKSADGHFYSICNAPNPPPSASPLPDDSPFRLIHDAGDASAAWDLGDAFLKVNLVLDRQGATKEHTTLDWLANKTLSFDVPKLLWHSQDYDHDRNYLIVSRVPGETVNNLWRGLTNDDRQLYAQRVADMIQELSQWQSSAMTGVDGKFLPESWLDLYNSHDFTPRALQKTCGELGMDCTTLYFCHCDFGPLNVLIDTTRKTIGVIDWEMAGYVPRAWARTKAVASGALSLDYTLEDYPDEAELEVKEKEYRLLVAEKLAHMGYPAVTEAYNKMRHLVCGSNSLQSMCSAGPVREALQQIDPDSWLIGSKTVLRRTTAAASGHLWSADGYFYSICDAPSPLPPAGPLQPDTPFQKLHDCADCSAVWDLGGNAILKVNRVLDRQDATAEHTTLDWLAERKLSFAVPKALYHAQEADRTYLIITRVPGETIHKIWRSLDESEKQFYAGRVADIIQELSQWQSNAITGVDGKFLTDSWLDPRDAPFEDVKRGVRVHDYTPELLRRNSEEMGMDCSTFFFCHCDFAPGNVLIDRHRRSVGLVDWEMAGYVPRAWPRTKAGVSWGLDIDYTRDDYPDHSVLEQKEKEWRLYVEKALAEKGFPEVTDVYKVWSRNRPAANLHS